MADAAYAGDLWNTSPHLQRVFPRREIFQRRVCAWLQLSREGRAESARLHRLHPERWDVVAAACRPILAGEERAAQWPPSDGRSIKRRGPDAPLVEAPSTESSRRHQRHRAEQSSLLLATEDEEKKSVHSEAGSEPELDAYVRIPEPSVWQRCARAMTAHARDLVGAVELVIAFLSRRSMLQQVRDQSLLRCMQYLNWDECGFAARPTAALSLPLPRNREGKQRAAAKWGGVHVSDTAMYAAYLQARLPAACLVEELTVFVNQKTKGVSIFQKGSDYQPNEWVNVVEQCLRRHREGRGADMMAFVLSLRDVSRGHGNTLLINFRTGTIARFEPHGSSYEQDWAGVDQAIVNALNQAARERHWHHQFGGGFNYLPPSQCCPRYGPQTLAETSIPYDAVDALLARDVLGLTDDQLQAREALQPYFEPEYLAEIRAQSAQKSSSADKNELAHQVWAVGMCAVWSQLVLELQLSHPDWDLLSVQSAMLGAFQNDPQGMSLSMWLYMLRYALDIQWIKTTFKAGCVMAVETDHPPPWLRWKPSVTRLRSLIRGRRTVHDVDTAASLEAMGFWLAAQSRPDV